MTKSTTDPLEVLDKNLRSLEGMKKHHEGFLPSVTDDWERAQLAYNAAREYYEERLAEIARVEEGIVRHREAIAILKPQQFVVPDGVKDAGEVRLTDFGLHSIGCQDHHHFGPCES